MSFKSFLSAAYLVSTYCFITEPVLLSRVDIYKCQSPEGYTTASSKSNFRYLRDSCRTNKCNLNQRELTNLSSLINNSFSFKHYQQKIGQNLIFANFDCGDQQRDVLITKNYYLIDLTKGREYNIRNIEDRKFYDSLYIKFNNFHK